MADVSDARSQVRGEKAHDAVAGANPVLVGGYASSSAPTNVSANGDVANVWVDLGGRVQVGDGAGTLTVDAPVGTPVFVRLSDGSAAITTLAVSIAAGATTTAKAEDAASADADVGVPAMAVRKATPANTSGTDGDYEMLQISAGRLWVSAVLEAGSAAVGKLAANSGVIIGSAELVPLASGGLTMSVTISAASTNATSVKASAGQLYEIVSSNTNATARYLKFYNKASAPTVGTDTPVWTILLPPSSSGIAKTIPMGLAFGTGIAFALTTGVANSDTGAVAANEIVVNLGYK